MPPREPPPPDFGFFMGTAFGACAVGGAGAGVAEIHGLSGFLLFVALVALVAWREIR